MGVAKLKARLQVIRLQLQAALQGRLGGRIVAGLHAGQSTAVVGFSVAGPEPGRGGERRNRLGPVGNLLAREALGVQGVVRPPAQARRLLGRAISRRIVAVKQRKAADSREQFRQIGRQFGQQPQALRLPPGRLRSSPSFRPAEYEQQRQ